MISTPAHMRSIPRDAALIQKVVHRDESLGILVLPGPGDNSNTSMKKLLCALLGHGIWYLPVLSYSIASTLSDPGTLVPNEPTFRSLSSATICARSFSTFSGTVFS